MRFAASPLLVAVALGLLGPAVLETEDEEVELSPAPETTQDFLVGSTPELVAETE